MQSDHPTETTTVLTIVIVLGAITLLAATVLTFASVRVNLDASTWPSAFVVSPAMPPRPHGVQEEDLPPFMFRDRAPSSADSVVGEQSFVGGASPVPC